MRKEFQSVVQLLQCYLRVAKLEMRVAEVPLKARVLERIEVLEEREREREQLLAQLILAMEVQGYDTAAVKAVMGG